MQNSFCTCDGHDGLGLLLGFKKGNFVVRNTGFLALVQDACIASSNSCFFFFRGKKKGFEEAILLTGWLLCLAILFLLLLTLLMVACNLFCSASSISLMY